MASLLALILVAAAAADAAATTAAEPTEAPRKSVLLWMGSPFGFWGGPFNQTKLDAAMQELALLKGVVDTVSVPTYFVGDPSNATQIELTGGLVPAPNGDRVTAALQGAGFRVVPLVGNFYNTNQVARYRYFWGAKGSLAFRKACVAAVRVHKLDGLNFDFEPADCDTADPPCSSADAVAFAKLLSDVKADLALDGHTDNNDTLVSVDTGQSLIAKTGALNVTTADRLYTMNTYGDTSDFGIALARDLRNDGAARFGLGVCPGCFNSSAADIKYRMDLAQSSGVRHLAFWSEATGNGKWWAAIRRWKALPLV